MLRPYKYCAAGSRRIDAGRSPSILTVSKPGPTGFRWWLDRSLAGGMEIAADQGGVQEIADADGEGDDAEGGGDPSVGFSLDLGDEAEGENVADGGADQQDARAAGTRGFGKLGDHGNACSSGDGGEALFRAQLAPAIE